MKLDLVAEDGNMRVSVFATETSDIFASMTKMLLFMPEGLRTAPGTRFEVDRECRGAMDIQAIREAGVWVGPSERRIDSFREIPIVVGEQ